MHREAVFAAGSELVRFARGRGLIRGEWIAIDGPSSVPWLELTVCGNGRRWSAISMAARRPTKRPSQRSILPRSRPRWTSSGNTLSRKRAG
jgi:hypothetical protein